MKEPKEKTISRAIIAEEEDEWNQAEDQHELTERQFDEEMAANKKAAQASKGDPKSQDGRGTPA